MAEIIETQCCIAGGGPAGMMLGFLLARAGVEVVVLEKHKDFLRDFRGDTVHPSTLQVMYELGLLQKFLELPHQKVAKMRGRIGGRPVTIADCSHLNVACPYIAMMPQWDFLNFIAAEAKPLATFHLRMETEAVDLVQESGRITGLIAKSPTGELRITSNLIIGADGRHSVTRKSANLEVEDLGAPIDVLWMRLSRKENDPEGVVGNFDAGKIMVTIDRGDYWQCAYVIPKGKAAEMKQQDIKVLRDAIASIVPLLADRVDELKNWGDVSLLTVTVDRLKHWWKEGLLCIGDAAHAMSPIGGVGINLAVQDAVATARILARPLRENRLKPDNLEAVQARREWPTRATQWLQVTMQERIIARVLEGNKTLEVPWPLKLLDRFPVLQRIPARIVGLGFRPEHIS